MGFFQSIGDAATKAVTSNKYTGNAAAWLWNLQPNTPNVKYSPGDKTGGVNNMTWEYPQATNSANLNRPAPPEFYAPSNNPNGGDGGYSAYQAQRAAEQQAALQEVERLRRELDPQFRAQLATDRTALDTDYTTSKTKLENQYKDQRSAMLDGFNKTNIQGKASYAAMGGGSSDSSGMNRFVNTTQTKYDKNLGDLNTGEKEQLSSMEQQLTKAKKALDVAENNWFNDIPKFNNLEELVSYRGSLDDKKAQIEKALQSVRDASASYKSSSSKNYSATALTDMFEGVKRIKDTFGNTKGPLGQGALDLWLSQYYTDPAQRESMKKGIMQGTWE